MSARWCAGLPLLLCGLLAAAGATACFEPQLDAGQFECRRSDECPRGFTCTGGPAYLCVPDGSPPLDGGEDGPVDGGDGEDGPDTEDPSQIPFNVAMGRRHSCAIMMDDSVRCWGDNSAGQLGVGDQSPRLRPTTLPDVIAPQYTSLGLYHTCITTSGSPAEAYCWGANTRGQLGNGSLGGVRTEPGLVSGIPGSPSKVQAAEEHTCVELAEGGVACWGSNIVGELGTGAGPDRPVPAAVTLPGTISKLSATSRHTCAALDDGSIHCWGSNDFYQLGNTGAASPVPVQVEGLVGADKVFVGLAHSCAQLGNGSVTCWGDNRDGQLGDGTQMRRAYDPIMPGDVGLTGVEDFGAGYRHNCVGTSSGAINCWGANDHGQIGLGEAGTSPFYTRAVPNQLVATNFATKGEHTCAILDGRKLYCWGRNDFGQLGDGTMEDRAAPTLVEFRRE